MQKNTYNMMTYVVICCLSVMGLSSCKKYLDVTPPNVGTLDYAFRNRNEAESYLFGCYNALQGLSNVVTDPGFVMSSEIIYPPDLENFTIYFQLIRGNSQNVSSPILNYWEGYNGGINLFEAIRKCNIMLENIDKPIDLSANEKARWIAEVKFLKGYYTYFLARMYGPIPLYKTNFPIDASSEEMQIRREPVDSVFNYAVQLMDEAIQDLPQQIMNPTDELGRITKLIALSVKAEILTTAASPLFNGNPDYSNFKDKEGTLLFNSNYDKKKWQDAADACKRAIDEAHLMNKKLYNFIPNASVGNLTDSIRRLLTIQNAVTEKWDINSELIWALNPTFAYQNLSIPRMYADNAKILYQAAGSFAVPLTTTELFYTSNGVPIEEDKNWDYAGRYSLQNGEADHRFYLRSGYKTVKANFDREPRFYASLGFDGGYWFGNGVLNQEAMLSVQAKGLGSLAGPLDKWTTNITAVWPKKLVSYLSVFNGSAFSPEPFRLPRIRLSGLYLLYAECLNEVQGPNTEVFEYVDRVRARAGLKGVIESWTNYAKDPGSISKKEGVRKIIHQERRSELCFEAQAGWDLRRWKEIPEIMAKPMRGWSIQQNADASFYQPVTQFIPAFSAKDYLWPLSDAVLLNNKKNVQNPLW